MRKHWIALVSVLTIAAPPAGMTDETVGSSGITRRVIESHLIEGSHRVLELILVEFPPGAQSAPHSHPAVGLNYILAGEVDSQYEGEPARRYRTGDTYQDPAGKKHLMFKNVSAVEPLKFLIAVELDEGQAFSQPLR